MKRQKKEQDGIDLSESDKSSILSDGDLCKVQGYDNELFEEYKADYRKLIASERGSVCSRCGRSRLGDHKNSAKSETPDLVKAADGISEPEGSIESDSKVDSKSVGENPPVEAPVAPTAKVTSNQKVVANLRLTNENNKANERIYEEINIPL